MPFGRPASLEQVREGASPIDALLSALVPLAARGQAQLADQLRRVVATSGRPVATRLNFADPAPFLDPSLFAILGERDPAVMLDSVLDRHAEDSIVTPLPSVPGSSIEIGDPYDPALIRVLRDAGVERPKSCEVDSGPALGHAWDALRDRVPMIHDALARVVRRVVPFATDGELGSFASMSAHGAIFLQPPRNADEVFFVEDVAHQGGHVLLSAATLDPTAFFSGDPEQLLSDVTGDDDDRSRTVNVAFHGVFTEALMSLALHRCVDSDRFTGRQRHELLGRRSYIMRRFQLDLEGLRRGDVFSDPGRVIFALIERVFEGVFAEAGPGISSLDLTGQPYAFSYDVFSQRNPAAR